MATHTVSTAVELVIDDRTRAALIALGWTPPADHEHVWTSRLCDNRESCHCGETREMATPEADDD